MKRDKYFPYTTPASEELGTSFVAYLHQKIVASLVSARRKGLEDTEFWRLNSAYEVFAENKELYGCEKITQLADKVLDNIQSFPTHHIPLPRAIEHLAGTSAYKNLFITDSGHLGLCPDSSQPGDIVAFIRNCRIPMVLRKASSGNYTLIGETYIHGFMQGEILECGPPQFERIILE